MLNENIKRIRKSKGLSQEELAIKLNVVRQTVSKWENGLSVPDSSILIILANELDTTVSELLGEPVAEPTTDDLKILSEKLEVSPLRALDVFYMSKVCDRLHDPETELYIFSDAYIVDEIMMELYQS